MSQHKATVSWRSDNDRFAEGKFTRAHTWSFDKESNPDHVGNPQDSNAYFQVKYGGLTIGAAMEYRQNFGYFGIPDYADQLVFGAGATYNWDAWTVGLGWTRGDYQKVISPNGAGPFNATYDDVALTASYALATGISVDGLIEYARYKSNDAAGPDYTGVGIGIGTAITF